MEHPFDVKYGQQFKMHFHAYIFCFFSRFTVTQQRESFAAKKYSCAESFFPPQTRDGAKLVGLRSARGKKTRSRIYALRMLLCKRILLLFAANKRGRKRGKETVGKSFVSFE
jgi:hypothetical protein